MTFRPRKWNFSMPIRNVSGDRSRTALSARSAGDDCLEPLQKDVQGRHFHFITWSLSLPSEYSSMVDNLCIFYEIPSSESEMLEADCRLVRMRVGRDSISPYSRRIDSFFCIFPGAAQIRLNRIHKRDLRDIGMMHCELQVAISTHDREIE